MSYRHSMPALAIALALAAAFEGRAEDGLLLDLDFQDTSHLASQPAPLSQGILFPDAKADFPGALDLGTHGYVRVPGFLSPRGPFTVEARFRVNEYAPLGTRYISDILNTATWDSGPTQGFGIRIGGGYLYAPMPREAYASNEDSRADVGWYDDGARAAASRCIGEFFMARQDDDREWKEVVTDRCIQRNAWVHMAGVWDGRDMRIYFDGQEATDTLRVLGAGARPRLDSVAVAFAGARADGGYDSRHLDGTLDFVRVIDRALSADEIRLRHGATLPARDTLCHGAILPVYPTSGQAVSGLGEFRFRVVAEGACVQPGFKPDLKPGDTVEIQIAKDPEFQDVLVSLKVTERSFHLEAAVLAKLAGFSGAAYWRARLFPSRAALAKYAASHAFVPAEPSWSLSRPFILDGKAAAVAARPVHPAATLAPMLVGGRLSVATHGANRPRIHSLDGKVLPLAFTRQDERWTAPLSADAARGILILGWE
ncbi:MAG: LamG domain-containing protein [Fibrobacteria bacterium]